MSEINPTNEIPNAELQQTKAELKRIKIDYNELKNQIETDLNFQQLIENTLNLINLIDKNGIIKYANYVLPELKYKDMIGSSVLEFLDSEYDVIFRDNIRLTFKGETSKLETKNVFGKYFLNHFIPYEGNHDEILLVSIDITEQKTEELALKESEEKYKALSQNSPGMNYHAYSDWSAEIFGGSELISGYTSDELNLNEENWLTIIHPDDKTRVFQEGEQLLEKPCSLLQTYRIIDKQNNIRWVED